VPRLISRHQGVAISGYEAVDNGGDAVKRKVKIQTTGAAMLVSVIASACLSVVGLILAADSHAPIWAVLLFLSVLAIAVPLGGVLGYLFYQPGESGIETSPHASQTPS
jgi:hypothetical protein